MTMTRIFYVIGSSGAGKDSLIDFVRENMPNGAPILFAHRYITRSADAGGENHVALSKKEFQLRKKADCFAMNWHSHDTDYGIGVEIDTWQQQGFNVIVNGSREYLPIAAEKYQNLVPVLICVDHNIMADRLYARGRETMTQITNRIAHTMHFENKIHHPNLQRIENNDSLEEAGTQLLQLLLKPEHELCA